MMCVEGLQAIEGEAFLLAIDSRGVRGEPRRLFVTSRRKMTHQTFGDEFGIEALLGWEFRGYQGRKLPLLPEG